MHYSFGHSTWISHGMQVKFRLDDGVQVRRLGLPLPASQACCDVRWINYYHNLSCPHLFGVVPINQRGRRSRLLHQATSTSTTELLNASRFGIPATPCTSPSGTNVSSRKLLLGRCYACGISAADRRRRFQGRQHRQPTPTWISKTPNTFPVIRVACLDTHLPSFFNRIH